MEVIFQPDAQAASLLAARMIAHQVRTKPDSVLGLATGSTPLRLYRELIRMHREEGLSFADVTSFNLDEYLGLGPDHPQSYRGVMQRELFDHIDIPSEQTHLPDGLTTDVEKECADYEAKIVAAGGIDLQVLGIGTDGHIGFNEPSSSLASRTRIKTLTERTLTDNAPAFDSPDEVPHHVITMGIGTILETGRILMLAFGASKAEAVAGLVEGPVTANLPASALQFHAKTHVFLDEAAGQNLARADYYRWVYDNKPSWQTPDAD